MTRAQIIDMEYKHAPKAELIPLDPPDQPASIGPWAYVITCVSALLLGAALVVAWGW